MKTIVYSLFGSDRPRAENCFDFNSYIRGLMLNIRMCRLLFPEWRIYVQTDNATYTRWKELFDQLDIELEIHKDGVPLTLAMLWRMRPIFEMTAEGYPKYTHVLCRDLDSPPTYREAQAVKHWEMRETAAHAITDSVSHNIPMLGGMIGFMPKNFRDIVGIDTWADMIRLKQCDWEQKGADQTFLNTVIYPKFAQSGTANITQHYCLGMPNTFLEGYMNHIPAVDMPLHYDLTESNSVCGHIGAAGYYPPALFKFLRKHRDKFEDLLTIEKKWPDIFHWTKDGSFE